MKRYQGNKRHVNKTINQNTSPPFYQSTNMETEKSTKNIQHARKRKYPCETTKNKSIHVKISKSIYLAVKFSQNIK